MFISGFVRLVHRHFARQWTFRMRGVQKIALSQMEFAGYGGPDCFNDMDMLVVGMHGKGLNPETSIGGCTDVEYQTHFALWAMMNSPLIIGCDVRDMTEETKKILMNTEVIALNQDVAGRSFCKIPVYANPDVFILEKPLANGDYQFWGCQGKDSIKFLGSWFINYFWLCTTGKRLHCP